MIENLYAVDSIRTFTGIYINVFEPKLEMICIEDIAHALSQMPRFGGHLSKFYSVAQQSIHCCHLVENKNKLAALLHDASEAYLMDIPSPIKNRLANYKDVENNLMEVIALRFGFTYPLHKEIKEVDEIMLQEEWNVLMLKRLNPSIDFFDETYAEQRFLNLYDSFKKYSDG